MYLGCECLENARTYKTLSNYFPNSKCSTLWLSRSDLPFKSTETITGNFLVDFCSKDWWQGRILLNSCHAGPDTYTYIWVKWQWQWLSRSSVGATQLLSSVSLTPQSSIWLNDWTYHRFYILVTLKGMRNGRLLILLMVRGRIQSKNYAHIQENNVFVRMGPEAWFLHSQSCSARLVPRSQSSPPSGSRRPHLPLSPATGLHSWRRYVRVRHVS